MHAITTSKEMRALDAYAIDHIGVPSLILMENAGRGAAEGIIREHGGSVADQHVLVFAGGGNNGGDGLVVARWLYQRGAHVQVVLLADPDKVSRDCARNLVVVRRIGIRLRAASTVSSLRRHRRALAESDITVDAIFGTGLSRPLDTLQAEACRMITGARGMRVALDIPSGVQATTGRILGEAARVDHTFTFDSTKWAHVLAPGRDCTGALHVVDIGIPPRAHRRAPPSGSLPGDADVRRVVPRRHEDAHKGTFGHVLVVAGSNGRSGAAVLSGLGALRSGAGLVTVAADAPTRELVHRSCPELMTVCGRVGEGQETALDIGALDAAVERARAVVIGPGLGEGEALRDSLARWLSTLRKPVVLDADALRLVAGALGDLGKRPGATVLTPHPGEMAALLDTTTEKVQADRRGHVMEAARRSGSVVALKGSGTLVANAEGHVWFNSPGGPWMATAGSGDVLAGCIGAMLAGGVAADDAAWAGVYLHARAGDLAGAERGEAGGLIATEIANALPRALTSIQ